VDKTIVFLFVHILSIQNLSMNVHYIVYLLKKIENRKKRFILKKFI